jgi:hypothetical protein
LNLPQPHFAGLTKSVSLRRKKRYTTETPGTERVGWRGVFPVPYRLIFSFWAGNAVGSLMRGFRSGGDE